MLSALEVKYSVNLAGIVLVYHLCTIPPLFHGLIRLMRRTAAIVYIFSSNGRCISTQVYLYCSVYHETAYDLDEQLLHSIRARFTHNQSHTPLPS